MSQAFSSEFEAKKFRPGYDPRRTGGRKHGANGARLYSLWIAMRQRCSNPRDNAYPNYGGRGIRVCERWEDFAVFRDDIGPRPDGYTLERVDNNGDYCPENCVWANRKDQGRNRRGVVQLNYHGETKPLVAWAEQFGIPVGTLHARIRRGWAIDKALLIPVRIGNYKRRRL